MKLITMDGNGQSRGNPGLTALQRRLLSQFNALDADGKDFIIAMLEGEYEHAQKERRPSLRLVAGGAA
jgi:hypothetical protein